MQDELKAIRTYLRPEKEGDIAPDLLDDIQDEFERLYKADRRTARLVERISSGKATHLDTQAYAVRVGELSSKAMTKVLTPEALPDGRMYYNIAQRTILPTMESDHKLITMAADEVEVTLREKANIGIKPAAAKMDQERVHAIIDKACSSEDFSEVAYVLDEPVKNTAQSFVDDFIRAQATSLNRWGMRPKITRTVVGGCCEWCQNLAGTYNYGEEPRPEFYQRHDHCRCAIIYDPGKGHMVQDSWSKKWRRR